MDSRDVKHPFDSVTAGAGQAAAMADLRQAYKVIYEMIDTLCAVSDESSIAKVRLKESAMWANECIARYGVPE